MNRLMPCLGVLSALATGCVLETETEMEEQPALAYEDGASMPPHDKGPVEPCGQGLVLGDDGKPLQIPVLCDPHAERFPDFGEEEVDPVGQYAERFEEALTPRAR